MINGSFEYQNDTLLLKVNADPLKKYREKEISYLFVADSLVIIGRDFIFPIGFKKSDFEPVTYFG